jgi:predicted DNA-binding ribbon-helix-helix protein
MSDCPHRRRLHSKSIQCDILIQARQRTCQRLIILKPKYDPGLLRSLMARSKRLWVVKNGERICKRKSAEHPGERDLHPSSKATNSKLSAHISRSIYFGDYRTSIRLEADVWDALAEICQRESTNIHELCGLIRAKWPNRPLTSCVYVYALDYFRKAVAPTCAESASTTDRFLSLFGETVNRSAKLKAAAKLQETIRQLSFFPEEFEVHEEQLDWEKKDAAG